jgi:PD-(D/E)XK nuclease superfamily protein
MTRPDFPEVINSSLVSSFRACPRKAELEFLQHWRPKNLSVHLHAGGAYAAGLEAARKAFYLEGKSVADSEAAGLETLLKEYGDYDCPEDSAKSLNRMAGALEFYFERYPFEDDVAVPVTLADGAKGIEFSFVEPLPVNHPVTGQPLLFSGRMDMLVEYAGSVFLLDDKTTSSLGASWPKQFDLRSQFTAYTWLANQAGYPVTGALVRGVSILKTKYDTMQCLTYRPKWMVERWLEQTCRDLERLKQMWESGYYDYNIDESCNSYGACQFKQVCLSADPLPWLRGSFEKVKRDPVTRLEVILES